MTKAHLRDFVFIALTRGSGFLITAAMLFSNSYALGGAAYTKIGQDLALAMLIVGPPLAILSQIQIRRVTANGDMARYLTPVRLVSVGAAVFLIAAFLVPPSALIWNINIADLLGCMGFIFGQSILVSTMLLASLTGNTRTQVAIALLMIVAVVVFSALRISNAIPNLGDGLLMEGCVLWLAGIAAIVGASRVPLLPETKPVYPFSASTMAKYAIAIAFFNGLLVLDWQLISSGLNAQDFFQLSQVRVTVERLLMPFLATIVSALLVGNYRRDSVSVAPATGRMVSPNIKRQLTWIAPLALAMVAFANLYWPFALVILPLGYVASSGVSYYLDLYQARHSTFTVFASLSFSFAAYAIVSWMAIHWIGAAGHALAWLIFNVLLTILLAASIKTQR